MQPSGVILPLGIAAVMAVFGTASASVHTLLASDGDSGDRFGKAVAISGPVVIAGAPEDNDAGSNSGSAYVHHLVGGYWVEETKLTALNAAGGDEFGCAVALHDDWAVIGAKKADAGGANAGAAYVFHRTSSGWVQTDVLLAPDAAAGDYFGHDVAIAGDTIAVSAIGDDDAGSYSGSVHLFHRESDTWIHVQKLLADDATASDRFGRSLGMTTELVAIGASGTDDQGSSSGSVYVFRRDGSTWSQDAKLLALDGSTGALLGISVAVSGNVVIGGAPEEGTAGPSAGAAYVFRHGAGGWVQEQKLLAPDAHGFDQFGRAVAISGSSILVGSPLADGPYPDAGRAYPFQFDGTTWLAGEPLVSPNPYYWDEFGGAVALGNSHWVAGATEDDDLGNNAGAAFLYDRGLEVQCPADVNGDGFVDFTDVLAVQGAWGACNACAEDINGDGTVDFDDVLLVLGAWGACP